MGLVVEKANEIERGVVLGITGRPGAGKTTLAASLPNPIIIDLEGGSSVLAGQAIAVHRTWEARKGHRGDEVKQVLRDVAKEPQGTFGTVVIDSWTRLSRWLAEDALASDPKKPETLNQAHGGYGAGARMVLDRAVDIIDALAWLADHRKMHVVWTLHEDIQPVELPTGEAWTEFVTQGEKKATNAIIQSCDVVAALDQKRTIVGQKDKTPGRAKGDGSRELFVGPSPYRATKSRHHARPTTIAVELGKNPLADIIS